MRSQPQYFRDGQQISAFDALDPHTGIMRPGITVRIPMSLRDATSHRLVDGYGNSDELCFSKPGFRLTTDAGSYDERQRCYDEYIAEKQAEWRDGNRR
jgi:hypothetical protein